MAENETGHTGASRWERRKEQTHRRLLDAAATLFLEKDFEAPTVEEIAALADVAKGTFFNYFESKEALLATLLAGQLDALLEDLPGVGQPALARIRLLLQRIWSVFEPYQHLSHHLFTCNMASPGTERPRPVVQAISQLLNEGQAHGDIRPDVNVEIAATLIAMHFLQVCVHPHAAACAPPVAGMAFLDEGLDILAHGIAAPDDPAG